MQDQGEVGVPKKAAEPGQFIDHLKKVNDIYYDQIRLADQKAAYIFTFGLAFLVTSAEARGVFGLKRYMEGTLAASLLSGLLGIAILVSMVAAISVVLPRRGSRITSLYWGGWLGAREELLAARQTLDPDYLFEQYLGNVDALAAINRGKYRAVGLAFRSLIIAVVSYVLLLAFVPGR